MENVIGFWTVENADCILTATIVLRVRKQWDYFKSRLSLIVQVNIVLNRTVVVDSDWRFFHLDDQTQPTFEMTPGFKPFTMGLLLSCSHLHGENDGLQQSAVCILYGPNWLPFYLHVWCNIYWIVIYPPFKQLELCHLIFRFSQN